ncbi:hypothetical protein DCS_07419 [Drechmeria coniospora]|uniref:Zn(2)-C6 fungal-type domain-containing protein n=1 Tax=Drechmeria coniospora TaxID=98403 RepID=A0A151GEE5_DRECN|nr:hypothetical protein DCS_07419 [Drechmeria coniospora]KYK55456.1 hypothetical protein DCS_07419 [Drechmeria coniospora]ODA81938.1 hypothetical protein RJ55_00443 [Drechmeria coniospora]
MPPRRSHTKSRAGCRRCKIRKIKCDEVHPRCGHCVKHGVACDFERGRSLGHLAAAPSLEAADDDQPSPAPTSTPTPTPTPTSTPTLSVPKAASPRQSPSLIPATPVMPHLQPPPQPLPRTETEVPSQPPPQPPVAADAIITPAPRQEDRLMEFRLLHHFTTSTAETLSTQSTAAEDIWKRVVPQMAFREGRTYLLDAILSVAALHLRTQHPDDKPLVQASHVYAASTLTEYRISLGRGITAENAESLFLTASLIAFQLTASRIFFSKDDYDASSVDASRYALPMPWFHAFQGVKTIVATSWQWIRHSDIVRAVIDSQPSFQLDLNPLAADSFFGHLLEGVDEELAAESREQVLATSQGYSHAVSVLNWAHKMRFAPAALAFPASVSRRFIDLVEERRPRALAILACFFALLKRMDNVWWLDDVSRREVMGLVSLFERGSGWWKHLEWPVRIALWDGNTIPSDVWGAECNEEPQADNSLVETMMNHIDLLTKLASQAQTSPIDVDGDFGLVAAPLD